MGSNGMFSGTISVVEKNLDIRSMRHNLIVSNIANKDTPNYMAFDIAVEEELKKMNGTQEGLSLQKTDQDHFPVGQNSSGCSGITMLPSSSEFGEGLDGNTVNIDKEMANLAENNLLYDAMVQIVRQKLQGLKLAIDGGNR
jgi:flagellar basal-body rod protein FlgB